MQKADEITFEIVKSENFSPLTFSFIGGVV
jgi:hypothetical protein